MKNALFGALIFAVIAVSVGFLMLLAHVEKLVDDTDAAVSEVRATAAQVGKDTHSTSQNLNAILLQGGLAADEARRAATEQRNYWNATAKQSDLTVRALRQLIDRTDRQLNDKLLPEIALETEHISSSAQVSFQAAGHSADILTEQLNDPHILSLAAHLDQSSANIEEATKHLDAASADIEKKVHQMTKPASFALRVGKAILSVAAEVGSMMGGFIK